MLTCPLCKKKVPPLERECPSCHADLSLLADYVGNLAVGLARAEELTRAGMLDEAVWAYLEVLEVDPDNAIARRQVGRVVTAVRQFDSAAPGRRWLKRLQRRNRFRRWVASWDETEGGLWGSLFWLLLVLAALFLGYCLGLRAYRSAAPPTESSLRQPVEDGGFACLPAPAAVRYLPVAPSPRHAGPERESSRHDRQAASLRHAHHPGRGARPDPPALRRRGLGRAAAPAV